MNALVSADGNGTLYLRQHVILSFGKRLFNQGNTGLGAGCQIDSNIALAPTLVGIDDERGTWRRAAHGGDTRDIAFGSKLDLEQKAVGGFFRGFRHIRRGAERERVSGREGMRNRKACQFMDRS